MKNYNLLKQSAVVFVLLSASIYFAFAGGPVNPSPTSSLSGTVTLADPLPVQDKIGRVSGTERYNVALATNSVTLLSTVCSFTPPVEITFNHKAASWIGDSDMASATIQTMEKHAADTWWSIKVSTSTYNIGMIADPAAVANVAISVHSLAQ
jgi:hypothetical protein